MKSNNSQILVRTSENLIFYTCLAIVLAVALFGIVSDLVAGR
ncbi:MAG TPA: hypothetical protein VJL58_05140 [Pyrinomonadaceae bacterium]|nr:hypothetical protein [Pyrinomonadaceae bacterium]